MIERSLAALLIVFLFGGKCLAEPLTWTDLTGAGRGSAQLEIDAAACDMIADQSAAGQPADAGPSIGLTIANIGAQMILKQNFDEECLLSKGWKQVPVSSLRSGRTQPAQSPEQRAGAAFAAKDYAGGLKLCMEAADENRPWGIQCVGSAYAKGLGVQQDSGEAMRWYRRAAATGDPQWMASLAGLYAKGDIVKQDYKESMRWYRMAADKGGAEGEYGVGLIFTNGWGQPKDFQQAMRWYLKAAAQGHASAQTNIGWLFQNGFGVPKDKGQARYWYSQASAQGEPNAKKLLMELGEE